MRKREDAKENNIGNENTVSRKEDERFTALKDAGVPLPFAFLEAYGDGGESEARKLMSELRAGFGKTPDAHPVCAPPDGEEMARLRDIWSREMALEGLKKIFMASLEGARVEVCDDNGDVVGVKFNPSAANAARAAVETANKMLGYTSPAECDGECDGEGTVLTIELGDAEEFAE